MRIWLIVGAIVALIGWGELRHHQGATSGKSAEALACVTADGARKDEVIKAGNEGAEIRADVVKTKSDIEGKANADIKIIRTVVDDCVTRPLPAGYSGRLFTEN
jgi:hypothetical protein